jgi:hypothetical protein
MSNLSAPAQAGDVLDIYEGHVKNLQTQIAENQARRSRTLAAGIAGVVLMAGLGMAAGLPMAVLAGHRFILVVLAASLTATVWTSRKFFRDRRVATQLARRLSFYQRGIERLRESWRGKGSAGLDFARDNHPYQADLDILGEGSLFELICTTRSGLGAERLAAYLLDSTSHAEARARQEAVKELRDCTALREEIALLGKYQFQNCDGKHLREWLSLPVLKVRSGISILLAVSSAISLMLGVCGFANLFTWVQIAPVLTPLLVVQATVGLALMRPVRLRLKMLLAIGGDAMVLRQGAALIERQQFHSAKLRQLVERLRPQGAAATIRALERLLAAIERREDFMLYGFGLWLAAGTQLVLAVERWRAAHQKDFEEWVDAWAEFEALNAFACYAFEHPEDEFPELMEGGARFEAGGLCHPLLPRDRGVGNDVGLNESRHFYLISGSNMAGKSTFLRALGLNAILALAGAPVRATQARMAVFNVHASIRVTDSLVEGKSKFLAEVERLRESIRATKSGRPVLFLIDEILGGTNSRDRRIAAESVIAALVAGGAVGALSTHDLALTEIAESPRLRGVNMHMQSGDSDQPLAFDYRVKPGVLSQTNALAIVRMMGIEVD